LNTVPNWLKVQFPVQSFFHFFHLPSKTFDDVYFSPLFHAQNLKKKKNLKGKKERNYAIKSLWTLICAHYRESAVYNINAMMINWILSMSVFVCMCDVF